MVQPKKDDIICDPSMGTAGFLVASGEYIHENHKEWFLDTAFREHYNTNMFNGAEFDATMMRIAAMNLQLHGIEHPVLISKDALSESNADMTEKYTLILANPPFKGSLDYDSVDGDILKKVKTKKTELLFLGLMLRALKTGGRCAVIVPDGVLFGSSNAHKQIRQQLVEKQKLQAVISMPSGVFKPYAGVSTAILLFTKTESGGTDYVWFYDMQADGYSLDDKRTPLFFMPTNNENINVDFDPEAFHRKNNIPDIVKKYKEITSAPLSDQAPLSDRITAPRSPSVIEVLSDQATVTERSRSEQSFLVPFSEIKANDWDLSINRYKEIVYEEVKYDKPDKIIADIKQLDTKRTQALTLLEKLLNEK